MKKIKDKKIVILIAVLLVFSIAYFTIANKISYAFENSYDLTGAYDLRIKNITEHAELYGNDHLEDFNDEGLLYIAVQTLIDEEYLVASEDGTLDNYFDESTPLNNKKIRIKNIEGNITAEIYS